MSLAPGIGEQAALYVEIFSYSAAGLIVFLLAIVLNWRVAKDVGKAVSRLVPSQLGQLQLRQTAINWLSQWQDERRRVRRFMTVLIGASFLISAFCASCILTIAGTTVRADGVVSQWQRWAGYTLAMTLTTAAMAQYYAIETVATWILALFPATAAMLMGVFISLTSRGTNGGVAKVVNFSIWGPVFLIVLIPIFYVTTGYSILKRFWRGFPIVVHVLFALGLWIVLWVGPEVAGKDTEAARASAGWAYYVLVLLWYLVLLFFFYFWKMGPPKRRTSATDAIAVSTEPDGTIADNTTKNTPKGKARRGTHKAVNFDQRSPNYALPPTRRGPSSRYVPETSRSKIRTARSPRVVINLRQ